MAAPGQMAISRGGVGVGHGQDSTVKIDQSKKRTESFDEQVKLDVRLIKE